MSSTSSSVPVYPTVSKMGQTVGAQFAQRTGTLTGVLFKPAQTSLGGLFTGLPDLILTDDDHEALWQSHIDTSHKNFSLVSPYLIPLFWI